MNKERYYEIINQTIEKSKEVLTGKLEEYATDTDTLHNFKQAAAILDSTPEQALLGFLTKHLVSLTDMIKSGEYYETSLWDEKIGDSINYLLILRVMIEEGRTCLYSDDAKRLT